MNENTLMSSPLDVFKDFEEVPDKMFETDKKELYGLIHTITNSDDFITPTQSSWRKKKLFFANCMRTQRIINTTKPRMRP